MKAYPPKVHYRLHPGYIAWILHRITGIGLVFYLILHVWVIHHIAQGPQAFNEVMAVVQSPLFHFLEVGLLACVAFHAINGIRVILIDYGNAAEKPLIAKWVWAVVGLTAVLTVIGGIPMIRMALH